MKKHFLYSSNKQLWRILISDSDKLILENRNQESKEVFFQCIDLQNGNVILKDFQFEEKNWMGVEAIYKDIIFFHRYPQRDLPNHKEIIAFDIASQKILWHNNELTFYFVDNNLVYSFLQGFEDRFFYSLDYLTGEIVEEIGNNYTNVNLLKNEADSKKNWDNYIYPEIKKIGDFIYESELSEYLLKYPVVGEIEEIDLNDLKFISFHTKEDDQTLTNNFVVFDKLNKNIVKKEILNKKAKNFLTDSFFIYKNYLFVLKGKNEIELYKLENNLR